MHSASTCSRAYVIMTHNDVCTSYSFKYVEVGETAEKGKVSCLRVKIWTSLCRSISSTVIYEGNARVCS